MGEIFAGRYELVDVLGSGGMGTVWRVWDAKDGAYRGAKVLNQSNAASLLRFVREQTFRVSSPHVLAPVGWAGEDDRVLFTMELIRGGSLASFIGDYGPLPPAWAAVLLDQLLTALEAVHSKGLVHRDVKPANLLLRPTGKHRPHLMLSDFGVAAPIGEPRLTRDSVVLGTPGYLAPEQLQGAQPEPRQDLYAAGMVALEMVLGRKPERHDECLLAAGNASALAGIVSSLVATRPEERFPSATAARAALADTGVLPAPDEHLDDGGMAIEVFDQLPPLPEGWDENGPHNRPPTAHADVDPTSPSAAPARRGLLRGRRTAVRVGTVATAAVTAAAVAFLTYAGGSAVGQQAPFPQQPPLPGHMPTPSEPTPSAAENPPRAAVPLPGGQIQLPSGPLPVDQLPGTRAPGGGGRGPEQPAPRSGTDGGGGDNSGGDRAEWRGPLLTGRGAAEILILTPSGDVHVIGNSGGRLNSPLRLNGLNVGAYDTVRRGDIDGDGDDDLFGFTGKQLRVHRNDGRGGFSPGELKGPRGYKYEHRMLADIDADGYDDFLGVNDGRLFLLRNNRQGDFLSHKELGPRGYRRAAVVAGDVDGDGYADIVGISGGTAYLYRNNKAGDFLSSRPLTAGFADGPTIMADLNGDRRDDVVTLTSGGLVIHPSALGGLSGAQLVRLPGAGRYSGLV